MDEIHNSVCPYAGLAHGVAERGPFKPRHEFVHDASVLWRLLAVGIDVERAAIPGHALGLDFELVGIHVAMSVNLSPSLRRE